MRWAWAAVLLGLGLAMPEAVIGSTGGVRVAAIEDEVRVSVKPGVRIRRLQPQMLVAVQVVIEAFREFGLEEVTITSGEDSVHRRTSRHYTGHALDFRTRHVADDAINGLVARISADLGPDFDVILEAFGQPNSHLHIEYDPKPDVGAPT